jgi:SAM-dependent methyltransferase
MPNQPTHHYAGYDIPIELMLKTGGGPDTFDYISQAHVNNLKKYVGIDPHFTVLEIGCGIGRDAIPLTQILDPQRGGRYIGIDIIKPSIDWCVANIQERNPNFVFHHMDIGDQLHNPGGKINTLESFIPVPNKHADRIILQSVFTHLLRPELEHYFAELSRVMKNDALTYATVFLYDEDILQKARATNLTPFDLRFEHEIEPGCRINNVDYPTGAVAYSPALIGELLEKYGLQQVRPPLQGGWSGFYPDPEDGQDVLILTPA